MPSELLSGDAWLRGCIVTIVGGVTRPCARARQAKRVLTQGRRGVQGRTGASRDKSLKMT